MKYAICTLPVAPMRIEAAHRSEMISQLLFGETVEVIKEEKEWRQIRSSFDGYEGWVTQHFLVEISEKVFEMPLRYITSDLLSVIKYINRSMHIPMGCFLPGYDPVTGSLYNDQFIFKGACADIRQIHSAGHLITTAKKWLYAPYLWGGKTILGVDCSGFVQTIFKLNGIRLKRDAWQQALEGETITDLQQTKPGDVGFFHNEAGRITHVGILMGDNRIIHAAGYVRIDTITKEGIITDSGERTHNFHSVKRFIKDS